MNDTLNVLGLALLGSVFALIGGVVFLYNKKLADKLTCYSVPFAAGVLLTVSILGLIPEAMEAVGERALLFVLLAFLGSYYFENHIFELHHHESKHHKDKSASTLLIIIGDTVHNFIDGLTIAASYLVNPGLGVITTVSTFLHEVPHEIGDFGILLSSGWKRKKVLLVNFFSALATIAGAIFVLILGSGSLTGYLLAIAAGMFLYLGASDFLPHIHEGKVNHTKSGIALALGALIMYATLSAVPHSNQKEVEPTPNIQEYEAHLDSSSAM